MDQTRILLDHGSGGKLSNDLIAELMLPVFDNPVLAGMEDGATLDIQGCRIAFSTDSYTVEPIFFPGGNIGDLAVNGTVNDVAMCGAIPLYLSAGMIIEAGFPKADLEKILKSMGMAAKAAGVQIVTGDTKVVAQGAADKIFINTSGIGLIPEGVRISAANARPGDKIILSGTIADHGMAVLSRREGLEFESPIESDSAALNLLVGRMLDTYPDIHVLRDPTRGGVGTALNEIALHAETGIRIYEDQIPVKDSVAGICELLGFDPLYVANEGKLLAFVNGDHAETLLNLIQTDPLGKDACIIGEVVPDHSGKVIMETAIGGERIIDMLTGEQLPRIC
ncbi:MAG TPA: hydrogenase expression/formation protein HypE [Desulfosalsimonadaceae bacterium]|nr:hydrogenase expression/formation protein HypE [Desulfosalsimonadaceae bacterium]